MKQRKYRRTERARFVGEVMKILKGTEIFTTICVSYMLISVTSAVLSLITGHASTSNWNEIFMLIWTSIAVITLSIHHLFDELPPLFMIVIQYVIAMGLVLLTVCFAGFVEAVGEINYLNVVINFSIPYVIGAVVYYISVFRTAKRQDALIQEIQEADRKK